MTNEEAIRILKDITWNSNGRYEITDMLDTRNLSIQALEENDKLKAEIERLVELMPKICETCEYEDEIGWKEPCNSCKNGNNWKWKGRAEK